jgi:hypothetical protein
MIWNNTGMNINTEVMFTNHRICTEVRLNGLRLPAVRKSNFPTVGAEWMFVLLRIYEYICVYEVPGSNLDQDLSYVTLSLQPEQCLKRPQPPPFRSFPIHPSPYHRTLYSPRYWQHRLIKRPLSGVHTVHCSMPLFLIKQFSIHPIHPDHTVSSWFPELSLRYRLRDESAIRFLSHFHCSFFKDVTFFVFSISTF